MSDPNNAIPVHPDFIYNPPPPPQTPIDEILLDLGNSFYQAGKKYGHHSTNVKELAFKEAKTAIYNLLAKEAVEYHSKTRKAVDGVWQTPEEIKAVPLERVKELFNVGGESE